MPEEAGNAKSLVFTVELKGYKLLVTGDISEKEEKKIIELEFKKGRDLSADILQVAHHGSRYSSCEEFCQLVRPGLAIIPVGKNCFGHPSADTLQNLKNISSTTLRTDLDGGIALYLAENIKITKTLK